MSPVELAKRGIVSMPGTLMHATEELAKDDVLRAAFGAVRNGSHYLDYFVKIKQDEFRAYHAMVSDWEINRYLTLF